MRNTALTLSLAVLLAGSANDAPSASDFSLDRALTAVDTAAGDWWSQRSCISCHTAGAYLIAPGEAQRELPAWDTVYAGAQSVAAAWDSGEQIEWLVATACFLAIADAEDGGGLQPGTVAALDRALSLQDPAGHWPTWLKCTWPPYESDDHFSVTLMAVALGMAGPDYAATTPASNGIARIRSYLTANPPVTLHNKAMLLWADTFHDDLVSDVNETQWIDELWALQRADGGWFSVDLGPFDLGGLPTGPPPVEQSDGFGTGFSLFILRTVGVNATEPRIQNGIAWLKANQDADGRWFTHSLRNRSGTPHYITNAGTVFAIKALYLCGEADQSSGTLIYMK